MFRIFLFTVVLLSLVSVVNANPNQADPNKGLAVHNGDDMLKLRNACDETYASALRLLAPVVETESRGQPPKVNANVFRDAHLLFLRMRRDSYILRIWSEPAGGDFDKRAAEIKAVYGPALQKFLGTPNGQTAATKARQFLAKNKPARQKAIEQLRKLIAASDWDTAEKNLEKLIDDTEAYGVFLPQEEQNNIYLEYTAENLSITAEKRNSRRRAAVAAFQKKIEENLPNYDQFLADVTAAATAIRTAGTTTVGDEAMSGPQLIRHFSDRWQKILVALDHCRGWDLALRETIPSLPADIDPKESREKALMEAYLAFMPKGMLALASIIDADTARAMEAEIAALHQQHLQACAGFAVKINKAQVAAPLSEALDKLAAKSPSLAQDVGAYHVATDELLRWRARVASALASSRAKDFMPVEMRFYEQGLTKDNVVGFFPVADNNFKGASITLKSIPEVLPSVAKKMEGKQVMLPATFVFGKGTRSVSRYQPRTYCLLENVAAKFQPATAMLTSELLVDQNAPPLTLAATKALVSANRGDLAAVGGVVTGTTIEGALTMHILLSDGAGVMLAVDELTQESGRSTWTDEVVGRFEVRPTWVRHENFFMDLGTPGATN